MKSTLGIRTRDGNFYLFDKLKKQLLLSHPLLNLLNELELNGTCLEEWVTGIKKSIQIKDIGDFDRESIQYYYNKYIFLKNQGYFYDYTANEYFVKSINEESIKFHVANLKQVSFEVTEKCNLNCKYCVYGQFYNSYDKRECKDLPFENAVKLIEYLIPFWKSNINISYKKPVFISFYGGEPLMNIGFVKKMIDYANGLNMEFKFQYSMTTNAVLLEKYMDFLVENNFYVRISLDGNKQQNQYRLFHNGTESFDLIFKNINALKDKYPVFFEKNVEFNTVIHKKNNNQELYSFFKENFNKTPSSSEINETGVIPEKIEEFRQMFRHKNSDNKDTEKNQNFEQLPEYDHVFNFFRNSNCNYFSHYNDLLVEQENKKRLMTGTCVPFMKRMFVTVGGKILPCERINHKYALGQLDSNGVSLNFKEIAEKFNGYYENINTLCSSCSNNLICNFCMFYMDNLGEKPKCPGYSSRTRAIGNLEVVINSMEKNPGVYTHLLENVVFDT